MPNTATGRIDIGSDLERKAWIKRGMLQARVKSFITPLTGDNMNSVVHRVNNNRAGAGHTVVFQVRSNFTGQAIAGRDTAYGQGPSKTDLSSLLTVQFYRIPIFNGYKFDLRNSDNLAMGNHSDSRMLLSDLFQRIKDQSAFDCFQGINGQTPSHIIDLGTSFDYNSLLDIEYVLKTSRGFSTGDIRRPLDSYQMKDGNKCWLFVVDSLMAIAMRKDPRFQTIMYNADVRGSENMLIKGIFGKLGPFILIEADNFFGSTDVSGAVQLDANRIEIQGLRQSNRTLAADGSTAKDVWTGQKDFDYKSPLGLTSRGFILGAGALQMGFGEEPDYDIQFSQDFKITSESVLKFIMHTQKTVYKQESGPKFLMAEVGDIDYGVIAIDVKLVADANTLAFPANSAGAGAGAGASGQSDGASGASGQSDGASGASGQSDGASGASGASGGISEQEQAKRTAKSVATRAKNKVIREAKAAQAAQDAEDAKAAQAAADAAQPAGNEGDGASGGSNDNDGVG